MEWKLHTSLKCLISVRLVFIKIYMILRFVYGEGNGNPLQYSCLENPMDGGAW